MVLFTCTAQYVHGPTGIQAMQGAASAWRWTVQDALGSVRGDFDAALDMQASRGYAPYGEALGEQGSFATPFGFSGEPSDANGLVHLRARFYESEMGQFLNQDPSWSERNLYQYSLSNPATITDPTGLCVDGWQGGPCRTLARRLYRRYGGNLSDYYAQPMSILLAAEAMGDLSAFANWARLGLDNASIIPNLADQNLPATYQALWQYSQCGEDQVKRILALLGIGIVFVGETTEEGAGWLIRIGVAAAPTYGAWQAGAAVTGQHASPIGASGISTGAAGYGASTVGGVLVGWEVAGEWETVRDFVDQLVAVQPVTFEWNEVITQAPGLPTNADRKRFRWKKRGCYSRCQDIRPTRPEAATRCEALKVNLTLAAAASTCQQARQLIDAWIALQNETIFTQAERAEGYGCYKGHCQDFKYS